MSEATLPAQQVQTSAEVASLPDDDPMSSDVALNEDGDLPDSSSIPTASSTDNESKKRKKMADKKAKRDAWKVIKKAKQAEEHEKKLIAEQQQAEAIAAGLDVASPTDTDSNSKKAGAIPLETIRETESYILDAKRYAYPYWFEFNTYAKRRWLHRSILEVLKHEYGNGGKGTGDEKQTEEYYRQAISTGAFRINGKKVSVDYAVKNNDHFQHYLHRHETPVTSEPIVIHYQDAHVLVVHKPSSVPVHPCGNYRHQTVLYMLARDHGLRSLYIVHRLDAVTSGLLILAKNAFTARNLAQQICDKQVRKEYVARVQGHFPVNLVDHVVNVPIYQYTHESRAILTTTPPSEEVLQAQQALFEATKNNRCKTDQAKEIQKEAITVVSFLAYDEASNSSLVKCCPLTGRTHQIRLHLKHLGFPIANDVRYGGKDTSSGHAKDLSSLPKPLETQNNAQSATASNQTSEIATDMPVVGSNYDAAAYWSDPAARRDQLKTESEEQRVKRIREESVDHSSSCPICVQMLTAQNGSTSANPNSSSAASSPSAGGPSSLTDVENDAMPDEDDSSLFSSTRVRVEYIWLHAYKYSFDPAFKITCDQTSDSASSPAELIANPIGENSTVTPTDSASSSTTTVSNSLPIASAAPAAACWSYEIPWPKWALEIVSSSLRQQHQNVQITSKTQ